MIHAIRNLYKSQKIHPAWIFWLTDLNIPSVSLKAAALVDIPFLQPYCSVTSMLLICRCWLNLLCVAFSSTIEKTIYNEIGL